MSSVIEAAKNDIERTAVITATTGVALIVAIVVGIIYYKRRQADEICKERYVTALIPMSQC